MARILIISSDAAFRAKGYSLLSAQQHEVLLLSKEERIVESMQSEKPDLLFWEISSNPESFAKLGKLTRLFDLTPVVIFLSEISGDIEKAGFSAGAKEVISKQAPDREISHIIDKILKPKKPISASQQDQQSKILIVDDEPSIRMLLESFFRTKGYVTLTAQNGEEALRLVRDEKPGLVLMDVMMPVMNGIEALKKIKLIDPSVGVIMATGVGDEEVAKEASKHGSYHYVLKPFDLNYLELVVLTRMTLAV